MAIKLQRIGLNMMVIASDDVVEKFIKWRAMAMAADSTTAETIIEAFGDVVFAMRKEITSLDHKHTTRSAADVMDILF